MAICVFKQSNLIVHWIIQ